MSSVLSKYTIQTAKQAITQQFREAGLDTPALDARLLMMSVMNITHADMIAEPDRRLTRDMFHKIKMLARRRLSGEPIDSVLGYRDFYGRRFHITQDVLSPRPETEGLIDLALKQYPEDSQIKCLDLGTGSGAIMLTLLAERLNWQGVAADVSQAALDVAKANADNMNVTPRLGFALGSWFEAVDGPFDLIVSNPPYIDAAHMARLSPEVKNYDPDLALFGGDDGLEAYRAIIGRAPNYLIGGGRLILEIGYDQSAAVTELLNTHGFTHVECYKDLSGHDRIMMGIWA